MKQLPTGAHVGMEVLKENKLLTFNPDTLYNIRKVCDLHQHGRMEAAVDLLREWIKKQRHFKKRDFSQHYLETTLTASKGSIERAKMLLDRMCTLRTLMPEYFGVYNVKEDFGDLTDHMSVFVLNRPTPDNERVYVAKVYSDQPVKKYYLNYLRYTTIIADYMKSHDYLDRIIVIYDFLDANMTDFLTNINFIDLKHHAAVLLEGFGVRPQRIHLLTKSKSVNTLLTIMKSFVKPKLAARIQVNRDHEELHDYLPREILPKDYGGDEPSIRELQGIWNEVLSSKETMEYLTDLNQAGTDESLRPSGDFTEQYAGMAGTFRFLHVD